MTRLTKRQSNSAFNLGVPLDAPGMERDVPKPRAKAKHPEAQLHAACAKYLRILQNQGKLRFHSNLPEGHRDPKRAGWFKAMSGAPGFPDIILLFADPPRAVFIELKSADGHLTEAQERWFDWLTYAGFERHLVRSVDALAKIVS